MPPTCVQRIGGRVMWTLAGAFFGFWVGLCLVGGAGTLLGTWPPEGLVLLFGPAALGAVRGGRIRVCTDGAGIAVHNPFRTYRFRWAEVERIVVLADAIKFPCPALRVAGRRRAIRLCAIPIGIWVRPRAVDGRIRELVAGWSTTHCVEVDTALR